MIYVEPEFFLRVASFDVGLKNMSMCVIDFHNNDFIIRKWNIISIKGKNISEYTNDTIEKLRLHNFGCLDYVLIEQQINRNTQMKVISHIIQSYFVCEVKIPPSRILFVSPKKRVENLSIEYAAVVANVKNELQLENVYSRKEFKNLSIGIAEKYLLSEKNAYWRDFFNLQSKKDDYADSLVQAIAWNTSNTIMDID
tara:strand:+ start:96 stop:686 length:591 start_codon:yes stop_codon:yes gene_type:complete